MLFPYSFSGFKYEEGDHVDDISNRKACTKTLSQLTSSSVANCTAASEKSSYSPWQPYCITSLKNWQHKSLGNYLIKNYVNQYRWSYLPFNYSNSLSIVGVERI